MRSRPVRLQSPLMQQVGADAQQKTPGLVDEVEPVDTLVKHFAAALGPRGIRVNAVAPGVVDTDMSSFARSGDGKAYTLGMQALQRLAQPDDIADAVAFLASNESRWVTGDTLRVDGGSKL